MRDEATPKVDGQPHFNTHSDELPAPPVAVQKTCDDLEEYRKEWAAPAQAMALLQLQYSRETRDALQDIANFLEDIRNVLGEIADK